MPTELLAMAALIGLGRALFKAKPQQERVHSRRSVGTPQARGHDPNAAAPSADRGRYADTPGEIPAVGWWDITKRVASGIMEDRIFLIAAGVTFYGLLAIFPATAATVSLYGLFADAKTINDHIALLSGFLPQGALEVVGDQVKRIASHGQGTLGFAFAGTLLVSLWGANGGTKAVMDALNIIYREPEKRSFIGLNVQSLLLTLASLVLVLVAMAGIVVVPLLLSYLGLSGRIGGLALSLLRWPLLYVGLLVALACLYRYGPSRAQPRWRWVTWGSGISGAVWIIGSFALSWYVANFGSYNATYGSLGALIGFLIWMWLSTIVVLIGAKINAEIEAQTAKAPP